MRILLASPGTGKTTKIKSIIDSAYSEASNILVLSFTNATINDLTKSFTDYKNVSCHTLHQYALIINHLTLNHILSYPEIKHLNKFAEKVSIDFYTLCQQLQCMTFDMMIESSIEFIKENPAYADEKIGKIDLLVIDEFQDFNELERNLVFLISEYAGQTIILGDDDQSIYDFKNADPEALIELYNDDSSEKIEHEHICYRCPDLVVNSCATLISKNAIRVIKDWNRSNKPGELSVLQASGQSKVCQFILDTITEIRKSNPKETFLILSHVRIASNAVIASLLENGIEIENFWKPKIDIEQFYLIWWLRAIYSRHRLLNLIFILCEHRQYTPKLIYEFKEYFKDTSKLHELIDLILSYKCMATYQELIKSPPSFKDLIARYPEFKMFERFVDAENLEESTSDIMRRINEPTQFEKTKINIMSIHKSKGLQADNVFILGLTEGLLPNRSQGTDTIEAQRRLLYVGMTRSQKRLWLISNVYWKTSDILGSMADKTQFKFQGRDHLLGKISSFINEMQLPVMKI
jgi:DNA helicase II / ATP-dependent DNA helicase PcrA